MATYIDLFAGCGGFSIGLKRAGLRSLGEVEIDAWAAESLRCNFPDSEVIEADIRGIDDDIIRRFAGVDVIVGGPPCQGFSVAGTTQFGVEDPRNELVFWYLHWVKELQPRLAIIENVPNILTRPTADGTVLEAVERELSELGYSVQARVLNAADYGTPQLRRRAFIVATAPGVRFEFPQPTHGGKTKGTADLFAGSNPYVTVGEAISDLPPIEAGEGSDDAVAYGSPPANAYQLEMRRGVERVTNHIAMRHSVRLVNRFEVIQPGQSLKDVPLEHGQVAKLTGEKVKNPFKYNNYRLDPKLPSLAIPASFQSLFLHPEKHRNLTAREAARIMGFPDEFVFKGKRTTMSWEKNLSQYNQIGNAVCPPVATAMGEAILRSLASIDLSLLPTASVEARPTRPPSARLKKAIGLPEVPPIIGTDVEHNLAELGASWLSRPSFTCEGFVISSATLPAALAFAIEASCPICSPGLAPFCQHRGEMPFLISKEDVQSLKENEQDHGLDYHLRTAFNIEHQVAHFVGDMLERVGLVEGVMLANTRTGRKVRGMKVLHAGAIDAELRASLMAALRGIHSRRTSEATAA